MKKKLLGLNETVRHKIRVASDRMKTYYDLKDNSVEFQAGDLVWLYNPRRRKGRCPKLLPDWEGPYTIVRRINKNSTRADDENEDCSFRPSHEI